MTYLTKVTKSDGRGGRLGCFCSTATGIEGYDEAQRWIRMHPGHRYALKRVPTDDVQVWPRDRTPDGAPKVLPQERP